jgi:hypothetical protein
MITVGVLAKKYGQLPSKVLARATTYDIMIDDVLTTWEKYNQNPDDPAHYRQEDLEAVFKDVRG